MKSNFIAFIQYKQYLSAINKGGGYLRTKKNFFLFKRNFYEYYVYCKTIDEK